MNPNQPPTTPQTNPVIDEKPSTTQISTQVNQELKMQGLPRALPADEEMTKDLNLSPGEELLCVINRHPIGIFQFYASIVLGIAALLVFLYFFITHKSTIGLAHVPDYAGVLMVVVLAVLIWLVNTLAIKIYKLNRLVLTSESLLVEKQQGLFNKNRKSLNLESIEDVSFSQKGIMQPMFNYGTLKIATVGKDGVTFVMADNPKKYADYINNAREEFIKNQNRR